MNAHGGYDIPWPLKPILWAIILIASAVMWVVRKLRGE